MNNAIYYQHLLNQWVVPNVPPGPPGPEGPIGPPGLAAPTPAYEEYVMDVCDNFGNPIPDLTSGSTVPVLVAETDVLDDGATKKRVDVAFQGVTVQGIPPGTEFYQFKFRSLIPNSRRQIGGAVTLFSRRSLEDQVTELARWVLITAQEDQFISV